MAYRRRVTRRYARKSKTNFIVTLLLIGFLIYVSLQWILPSLITGLGFLTSIIKPAHKAITTNFENISLAPPVLNIAYEATNTAQINISGYGTPHSKVELFLDDEKKDTIDVSVDGNFEFKNISLSLGTNVIFGKSIDEKNRLSLPSKTIKVLYDNEKPKLILNEPEDGKKIQGGGKVKFSGKTEPGVQIFINDNQIIVDKDGNFSVDQSLSDGENNFNVKAEDSASNTIEILRKVTYQP